MRSDFVFFDDDVDPKRISNKATLYQGCTIKGKNTLICDGAELGSEAPVTLVGCYIGPGVKLKGGYFENAVFLSGASAGSGAHVRGGTIFEEQSSIAHTVGLKQTILFPFVTLGSLINFCDCLMAGGTSRKNHSEVGSSYIHFNYTPNQDKATASLMGDVPSGVMLNQNPIFLGGQGGLVGPCRIAYGTVIAAGSIYRKDQLKPDRLVFSGAAKGGSMPYSPGIYTNIKRQAINNLVYVANLLALMVWYRHVRRKFIGERLPKPLYEGLLSTLEIAIDERVKRFVLFCEKLKTSSERYQKKMGEKASAKLVHQKIELFDNRNGFRDLVGSFLEQLDNYENKSFFSIIDDKIVDVGLNYLQAVQSLNREEAIKGTKWLKNVTDEVYEGMIGLFPSLA
jgi:bifunctional UDP-N-acetylglucosamine pyrophosphorylase/glucosamine-1-phosphate N-acetyltransferase